jgi:hypothetical protein
MFDATVRPILLAVVVTALLASGCGSADRDPNLAAAAAKTEGAGSSRFEVSGSQLDGTERTEIACTGEADYEAKRVRVRCDYGATEDMEMVAVGADTYMRGDVFGIGAFPSDKWVKLTGGESLGDELSPRRLLAMLRGASQSTDRVGDEDVRGVDTVRYRLEVDCEQAEIVDCDGSTAPVDVWVGDDGLVRRIAVEEGTSPFVFEFFDFGADVDIQPPPPGEVEDVDKLFGSSTCEAGFGAPIGMERAMDALRRHGFTITGEPECSIELASFANDSAGRGDEGHLYCVVRDAAPAYAPIRVQPVGSGVSANAFRLHNLECTLISETVDEAKLARLRAALTELER